MSLAPVPEVVTLGCSLSIVPVKLIEIATA